MPPKSEGDAGPPASSSTSNGADSGTSSIANSVTSVASPESLWDARLGYFAIRPADIGDMSPAQLLGCADLFHAMYGGD